MPSTSIDSAVTLTPPQGFVPANKGAWMGITDGGVNPRPDVDQKAHILVNAVRTFHALGCACPHVAILSAVETPSELFPASLEAVELVELWRRGGFPECVVDGPLAFDLALSSEAAQLKGVDSRVAGRAGVRHLF